MISIQELQDFTIAHVAERAKLENYFMVASDDELARLYKDTPNPGDQCTLVVIIPSHDSDFMDEDNLKMNNNLSFMIIKKTDTKAGNDEKIRMFGITQVEIKALLLKILSLYQKLGDNCVFRDMELDSIQIDPVQDYIGANGYGMDFVNRTEL